MDAKQSTDGSAQEQEFPVQGIRSSPVFFVADILRSTEFYSRIGFDTSEIYGKPACFCVAKFGTAVLMLAQTEQPLGHLPAYSLDGFSWDAHILVSDARRYEQICREQGAEIVRPLDEANYDMLEFVLRDPDGYTICFGQNL